MSHSAFKILANDEPINHNLVIVMNKSGQIGTDTEALQNLLVSKGKADTAVTVLRETSPTPSISEEIEQERNEKYQLLRQQYLAEHINEEIDEEELEKQIKQLSSTSEDEAPHVTMRLEQFYPSEQARKFANDVLHLGGVDNPQTLMPIDFNFRRKIIENDHCYTPLTLSPEPAGKSSKGSIKSTAKSSSGKEKQMKHKTAVKAARQQAISDDDDDDSNSGEMHGDDDEEYDDEQSEGEEEISFSESDDDNDMDFSVNDRFGKKGKRKRKYRKNRQKSMTFKDFLEGNDVSQNDDEPKKKYGKSPKKIIVSTRPSTSGVSKNVVKEVKKTPQIKSSPLPIRKEPVAQFVPLTVSYMKNNNTQLPTQISVQSTPLKSAQEIDFVESMVKDLEKTFPEGDKKSQTTIPNIVQMMDTNTSAETIDQSLSSLEQMDSADGTVPGMEEIGDALIAVLGDEAIDELLKVQGGDLMNFDHAPLHKTSVSASSSMMHSSAEMAETSMDSNLHPKILNTKAPAKDAIKVVRNGRVITLPPIEAPTTRGAKRRAQGDTISISLPPTGGKVAKVEKALSNKDPDSRNSSRRSSLNKSEGSGRNSRRQSTVVQEEMDDLNSDGTWNSEDDPDRLWCICKQPHNNRFMICCDKCEDWFHGKCVNVTKAMGKEMEGMGVEWRCPNCKAAEGGGGPVIKIVSDPNKKPLNQQKLTKFFAKSQDDSKDEDAFKTMCAVCQQMPARTDSIYCSDDCIRNHATTHLDDGPQLQKSTSSNSIKTENKHETKEVKRGNILKDQSGNVIVYDKTTGKILPHSKWPQWTSLSQWLKQNLNCEPVKPGSPQAETLINRSRNKDSSSQPQTPTSTTPTHSATSFPLTQQNSPLKHSHSHNSSAPTTPAADDLFSNPVKIHTGITPATAVPAGKSPQLTLPKSQHINSSSNRSTVNMKTPSSPSVPKLSPALSKSSNVTSTSSRSSSASSKHDSKKLKHQTSDDRSPTTTNSSKLKIEQERLNVRKILKDTLVQRMQEFDHPDIPKMSEGEIVEFAKEIEKEMFYFFNKDTRDKYKTKYRSLKFNLSDVKNKTLLEKICARKLTPKQLVELPPSALASDELAKWREDENKHQLEIITKSELDALAQNKNLVVKTHKGEEIIETKSAPSDVLMPVDDVESAIVKSILSADEIHKDRYDLSRSISLNVSGHSASSPLSSPSISSSTGRKSETHNRSRSRSKSRGKDHHHHSHHHKSSSQSSKHKKSDRHRSKSRHRSRSKDRKSRDRSHERSKSRSDHKHRDKSRSHEQDKSNKSKDHKGSKDSKHHQHHSSREHSKEQHHQSNKEVKTEEKPEIKTMDIEPDQTDADLVGKILGSMGVTLEKPKPIEAKQEEITTYDITMPNVTSTDPTLLSTDPINEHQLEIEIYSGNLHMADVARFDVTASIVSGDFDDILKLFTPQMEVVGRIEPATVWDYLEKVKKIPGKEICILRFASEDESKYFHLFSYLNTRQRYGVIKSPASKIKDFYLVPIEANRPLPPVLLPIKGPGFIEGEEHKKDLLLGVILKITPEAAKAKKQVVKKVSSKSSSRPSVVIEHPIEVLPPKHKTHSSSSKLTMNLPGFTPSPDDLPKMTPVDDRSPPADGDEPYSPFDEEFDANEYDPSTPITTTSSSIPKMNSSDDLKSQVEKLQREIERRQMEIQTMAQSTELKEEEASKIFNTLELPANLTEILSKIKNSEVAPPSEPMSIDDDDDDDEYVPTAISSAAPNVGYRASSSVSGYSAVPQMTPIVNSMMDIDERVFPTHEIPPPPIISLQSNDQPSRLANMSDADLMKLVPDDMMDAPPPPQISRNEPPIPGLDNDYEMNN